MMLWNLICEVVSKRWAEAAAAFRAKADEVLVLAEQPSKDVVTVHSGFILAWLLSQEGWSSLPLEAGFNHLFIDKTSGRLSSSKTSEKLQESKEIFVSEESVRFGDRTYFTNDTIAVGARTYRVKLLPQKYTRKERAL